MEARESERISKSKVGHRTPGGVRSPITYQSINISPLRIAGPAPLPDFFYHRLKPWIVAQISPFWFDRQERHLRVLLFNAALEPDKRLFLIAKRVAKKCDVIWRDETLR